MTYYLDPFYSGYTLGANTLMQKYTPVAIDFRSALRDSEEQDVNHKRRGQYKPKYFMRITPPRSSQRGLQQHLSDSVTIKLPENGVFRYQLVPSDLYYPKGRYIVEYFRQGSQIPIDTQHWLVPPIPKILNYTFVVEEEQQYLTLPIFVWQVNNVSPASDFISEWNRVTWLSTPAVGTTISVNYQPAATLDRLVEYKLDNLEGVTRIRY
jgi:hypothetical protein